MSMVKRINNKFTIAIVVNLMMVWGAGASTTPGSLSGAFQVYNGNATYSINIDTPPARGGMKPGLSLNYSSGSGNGLMGLGWSMGGMSRIHRCPKTKQIDGHRGEVKYDANDRLCVDGQRLILVSGTYGSDGAVYRTKNESYSEVVSYGGINSGSGYTGPNYFEIRTKSGLIQKYGFFNDSRVKLQASDINHVWALDTVHDTSENGEANSIRYHYNQETTGSEYRLDRVTVDNVYIQLNYEHRADIHHSYHDGRPLYVRKRLKNIETGIVEHGADIPFKEYGLAYQYTSEITSNYSQPVAPFAPYSQLISVTECANQDPRDYTVGIAQRQCYEPTVFRWDRTSPSTEKTSLYDSTNKTFDCTGDGFCSKEQQRTLADINGDGVPDAIGFSNVGVQVALGLGNGKFSSLELWLNEFGYDQGWRRNRDVRALADVNGDGLSDIVGMNDVGTYLALSTGDGFQSLGKISDFFACNWESTRQLNCAGGPTPLHMPRYLSDVNGDGKADIVHFGYADVDGDGTAHSRVYVALSNGVGFNQPQAWYNDLTPYHGLHPGNPITMVDMNGDGKADIVAYMNKGVYIAFSTGSSFAVRNDGYKIRDFGYHVGGYSNLRWTGAEDMRSLADVNGDGLIDIVGINNGRVYLGLANGNYDGEVRHPSFDVPIASFSLSDMPFRNDQVLGGGLWNTEDHTLSVMDVNGDNQADIVAFGLGIVQVSFAESYISVEGEEPAVTFSEPVLLTGDFSSRFGMNYFPDHETRSMADVDGDGFLDLVGFFGDGIHTAVSSDAPSTIGPMQLITSISDGSGNMVNIDYKSMMDESIYQRGGFGVGEGVPVQFPRYLVSSVGSSNGALDPYEHTPSYDLTEYKYGDFRVDIGGYGALGFAWREEYNFSANKVTRKEYSQAYPTIGYISKTEEYLMDASGGKGILVNQSTSEYIDISTITNVASPQLMSRVDKTYDEKGVLGLLTTVTTTNSVFDNYGNIGRITVTTDGNGESFSTITDSLYSNDTVNWWLGRMTRSVVTHTGSDGRVAQRVSEFGYDPMTGLLEREVIEPGNEKSLTTEYEHNQFGKVTRKTISSNIFNIDGVSYSIPATTTQTIFDSEDRYPMQRINAAGHREDVSFNRFCGEVNYLKGPNQLETRWVFDSFCRKVKETRADGVETNWVYEYTNSSASTWSFPELRGMSLQSHFKVTEVSKVTATQIALPEAVSYFDSFGRKLKETSTGLNGEKIHQYTIYNEKGQVQAASLPHFENQKREWSFSKYDVLGRIIELDRPGTDGLRAYERTAYNGLTLTHTNAKGQIKTRYKNALGNTTRIEEEEGAWVSYTYDPLGNLEETNANGIITSIQYDLFGNKINMNDPDMGYWEYQHDPLGRLVWQKDANGNKVTMKHDGLNRMIERIELEGVTTWHYDTAIMGIGKLDKVKIAGVETESYQYDSLGRLFKSNTTIDGQVYTTEAYYDAFGRLEKEIRPQGLEVENIYNDHGYLVGIRSPKAQVQDYNYASLLQLISDTNVKLSELHAMQASYQQTADNYRLLASQLESLVDQNITLGLDQLISERQLMSDAAELRLLADEMEAVANSYLETARYYENLRIELVVVAAEVHGYDWVFVEPQFVPIAVGDITIFVPLSAQGMAELDKPLTTEFAQRYGEEELGYRTQMAQQITLADENIAQANIYLAQAESADTNAEQARQQAEVYFLAAQSHLDQAAQYREDAELYNAQILELQQYSQNYSAMEQDYGTGYIYFWRANSRDAIGRLTSEIAGNGLSTQHYYDAETGQLKSIKSGFAFLGDIRHIEYDYDDLNNVTSRYDQIQGLTEGYLYDRLNRLEQSNVSGTFAGVPYNHTVNYAYDEIGNITYKSDVGYYSYGSVGRNLGNAGPHALRSAGSAHADYQYDNNGNLRVGGGREYQWGSFNKPTQIKKDGTIVDFVYGSGRNRIKKVSGDVVTHYIGKHYERTSKQGNIVEYKHFIYAEGRVIATHVKTTVDGVAQPDVTQYLHYDALGSVDTITDGDGNIVERMSFDAFGKRRQGDWRVVDPTNPLLLPLYTNRGYTGHEHIDEVGLIHMNGRIYDPEIGRFISADSIVPDAEFSQAYNRYSYVYNNPLKYTDPSGHNPLAVIVLMVGYIMATQGNRYFSLAGQMMMVWAAGNMYGGLPGTQAAMAGGATMGFINGSMDGGVEGAVKGAVIGAATAYAFHYVGDIYPDPGLDKVIAHGVVGGLSAELQGENFGDGFRSAAMTQTFAPTIEGIEGRGGTASFSRVFVAGMVGGTTAELNGGKFENGAITGTFSRMFNGEFHRDDDMFGAGMTYDEASEKYGFDEDGNVIENRAYMAEALDVFVDKVRGWYIDTLSFAAAGPMTRVGYDIATNTKAQRAGCLALSLCAGDRDAIRIVLDNPSDDVINHMRVGKQVRRHIDLKNTTHIYRYE